MLRFVATRSHPGQRQTKRRREKSLAQVFRTVSNGDGPRMSLALRAEALVAECVSDKVHFYVSNETTPMMGLIDENQTTYPNYVGSITSSPNTHSDLPAGSVVRCGIAGGSVGDGGVEA
jgi:hypothetical protein